MDDARNDNAEAAAVTDNGSPLLALDTVGVVAVNSPAYVRRMLDNLQADVVSVPLRAKDDTDRLTRTATKRVITPDTGSGWLGGSFASSGSDAPAQVSFSSGTEGAPKAVLLSKGNLHDVVTRLNDAMEMTEAAREYAAAPVFHSFGYARCRAVLSAGGDVFVPAHGLDLAELRDMLRQGTVNAVSAVPSQWRIFLRNLDLFGPELERIRWIEIGSQFMSASEKRALRDAASNARIVQHYGLTEASRSSLLRIDGAEETALRSVGRATGDTEIKITEAGRIAVRGPHVALGVDDGTTWRALGREEWLVTSDLGHFEGDCLIYEGRADDVINCAGVKLSPDLIEDHVRRAVSGVGDFAILSRPDPVRGDGIGLALTPDAEADADRIVQAVAAYAAKQGLDAGGAITRHHVDALPKTETGKLRRKDLARQLDASEPPSGSVTARPAGFLAEIADLLGPRALEPGVSFSDLGSDSLQHMQMTLALDRALGATPENWEFTPLNDLAEAVDAAEVTGTPARRAIPPLNRGETNRNPEGIGFWELVREDFRTNDSNPFHQGFLMLFVHRFGNQRMTVKAKLLRAPLTLLYLFLNKLTQILFGMKLDYTVEVGRRVKLEHFGGMILGARRIGNDVILRQNTTLGIRSTDEANAKPVIGDFVDIGAGAVVVGDVTIGRNSVVGANSVVYMNVPPDSVVVGVPGRVIGKNPRQNPSPLDVGRKGPEG